VLFQRLPRREDRLPKEITRFTSIYLRDALNMYSDIYEKMYNFNTGGYQDRPHQKPIRSHYDSVEIPHRFLGGQESGRITVNRVYKVEGLLKACVTKNRSGAPDPGTGQDLTYSGFDRGHLIALELGGVDHGLNIVPQVRLWQQTGEWRGVERDILAIIKKEADWTFLMTVELAYSSATRIDPIKFKLHVQNTVTGAIVYEQDNLTNLPGERDKKRSDKDLNKLEQKGGDGLSYEVKLPPPDYQQATYNVQVAAMPRSQPGQLAMQSFASGTQDVDMMDMS